MTEVAELLGVKETKEAIIGVNELSLFLCQRLKDGVQVGDAVALWAKLTSDAEFMSKIQAAYDGAALIPAEMKNATFTQDAELIGIQLSYLPKFIEALKGKTSEA